MDELPTEPIQGTINHEDGGKEIVEDDSEKLDSGVGEDSNSCGMDTGDASDDDEVLSRVIRRSAANRVLDDSDDESMDEQETPTNTDTVTTEQETPGEDTNEVRGQGLNSQKQEYTDPEEVLALVMADSDDEENGSQNVRNIKARPSMGDSSDEDDVPLATAIKLKAQKSGHDDIFDSEETADRAIECRSSDSELEKSDDEKRDDDDEGFDETKIDPKLLKKLKMGAAKKPKKERSRKEAQSDTTSIHSETQRLIRESRVSLPYHQPAPRSINDFLARVSKKQHEYKVLKGVKESTKAKVLQDILMKTSIQSAAEQKEEKYSDSDEDWNPEEEKEKTLKERLDAKAEAKLRSESEPTDKDDKFLTGTTQSECDLEDKEETSLARVSELESAGSNKCLEVENGINDNDGDESDELPDICEEKLLVKSDMNKISIDKLECVESVTGTSMEINKVDCAGQAEKNDSSNQVTESVELNDDLLFEWEKCDKSSNTAQNSEKHSGNITDSQGQISGNSTECVENSSKHMTEDIENVDPNIVTSVDSSPTQSETTAIQSSPRKSGPVCQKQDVKSRLSVLAGIDLDSVKPCLSGQLDSVINLVEEEEKPQHPGILNLMDRLCKHSTTRRKSRPKKDVELSVISKTQAGPEKEELKLDTFTYHGDREEENPLLKLETPGAKLLALKEQLQSKMRVKRELARQQRQELHDLDNEEGGFEGNEEEELEMSEHSDTDVEDEEFEEQFGDDEEEEEYDEEVDEKERERNPFADDEAEDDDEDGYDVDDDGDEEDEELENEDDMQLKLDVSDEELEPEADKQDDGDVEGSHASDDDDTKDVPSAAEFKEPTNINISEKPFSMFGSRSRESSISDTQFQSAQRPTPIQMPIEDSQDLFVASALTSDASNTQQESSASQDFNFFLDDSSQSNMLDADGFLRTKSSEKKKGPLVGFSASDDVPSTQGNFDELLGLCSGRFVDSQPQKSVRKGLFDDAPVANTQDSMADLVGMCSGVFADRSQNDKTGSKRKASDDEDSNDSFALLSDNDSRPLEKDQSSDEGDGDIDRDADTDVDISDAEDEDRPTKFTGFTQGNKHGKIRQEFVDEEAELSGSEIGSDEDLDLAEEDDIMEIEEGDNEAAKLNEEELRDEVGRVHLKQVIDEDKRELMRFQEMYLPDGDLHSEGAGRMRRFRWSNMDDDTQQDMFGASDEEPDQEEQDNECEWRKQRYEREKFLHDQHEKESTESENSQFLKLGKVFLKRQESLDVSAGRPSKTDQLNTSSKTSSMDPPVNGKPGSAETPGFPGSFYKLSKQKRGSFLARSKEALAKIADMTKPVLNPSAGAKNSGKFTFQVLSPEKTQPPESAPKTKQRKAHVPSKKPTFTEKPAAKKPKLDTNSIFNHL